MPFDDASMRYVVSVIALSCGQTDARVLAYAVMRNHIHIVVRQGHRPLASLMQPMLCRIALYMQRKYGTAGHVVERRFRSTPCLSAGHLREAIAYTHLNPVRGGLCDSLDGAQHTSHHLYADTVGADSGKIRVLREVFATRRTASPEEWREDYLDYMRYREACDAADAVNAPRPRIQPDTTVGDEFFSENFASLPGAQNASRRTDLRDIAVTVLSARMKDLPVSALRGNRVGSRQIQSVRHQIIRIAARQGHSGVAIADYFNMSPSRVSEIVRSGMLSPHIGIGQTR